MSTLPFLPRARALAAPLLDRIDEHRVIFVSAVNSLVLVATIVLVAWRTERASGGTAWAQPAATTLRSEAPASDPSTTLPGAASPAPEAQAPSPPARRATRLPVPRTRSR